MPTFQVGEQNARELDGEMERHVGGWVRKDKKIFSQY